MFFIPEQLWVSDTCSSVTPTTLNVYVCVFWLRNKLKNYLNVLSNNKGSIIEKALTCYCSEGSMCRVAYKYTEIFSCSVFELRPESSHTMFFFVLLFLVTGVFSCIYEVKHC